MALVKYNNNSIANLTSPGQLAQGKMTLISSQTASGSASIEFTSGIDSTYPIYKFEFINIHGSVGTTSFNFNLSTDNGSNYNVTKTSTLFRTFHDESDSSANLTYDSARDLAQSTSNNILNWDIGIANDENLCGEMFLFNPSSTTFVKHYIACISSNHEAPAELQAFVSGYGNTTSAIDAIKFVMSSGNIDSGTIKLYGIKGD